MNTTTVKGDWNAIKGKLKKAYGQLTDDDFKQMEGNKDQAIGYLQKKLGKTKEEVQKFFNEEKSEGKSCSTSSPSSSEEGCGCN